MNSTQRVLAVELPAPCPLACGFCRTPNHGQGDTDKLYAAIENHLLREDWAELYLTSNGETGLSPLFAKTVELARSRGIATAVLCATEKSIEPGIIRAEISVNEFTTRLAERAIAKAKKLGIPMVVSTVDTADTNPDAEELAKRYGADAVLIRALQQEGRSYRTCGTTRVWQRAGSQLGAFPVAAYAELRSLVSDISRLICIGPRGNQVPLLGGAS